MLTHSTHAALTLLSCGMWLPIWILCAVFGWIYPTRCTICGNIFKRKHGVWIIDGKKEYLCLHCSDAMERRMSRQAMRRRR